MHPAAARLRHVYWLGGGSGAGKSTISRRLADRYGMRCYATDDVMADHAARLSPADAPHLSAFAAMDMDERWVHRSPRQMLDTFHWYHGEGFDQIVADLLRLPTDRPVLAEGFRLLPDLVAPLLADRAHAVWLLPTTRFRRAVFASRGGTGWGFIARTGDPGRALRNLVDRDGMFTERLAAQVRPLGLTAFAVDTPTAEDDLLERVATAYGLTGR
ncbi:hypothetical protein Cs7R123_56180 [Catellatospora sp. TT07R-123]|uniref:hypothetical protein n=1 Tax=Catellatospora sp. TT07R-123 TaxID=2733863 RepID=UPI001B0730B2|nr:hypothetical protein [Catellatospora sp. TT07R-123]GHJ48276.1 hypothetical protein Cs7R123_56180 [Catellatospora sp. TT07R-123]